MRQFSFGDYFEKRAIDRWENEGGAISAELLRRFNADQPDRKRKTRRKISRKSSHEKMT
jgi:hypothetical protein